MVGVICYDPAMFTSSVAIPSADDARVMLSTALGQLEFARRYTLELLEAVPQGRWGEIPAGMTSCVAWQVGHLAVSHYGLLLFRIRGRQPDDLELVPGRFRKAFGRGSDPAAVSRRGVDPDELLGRLAEVDRVAREELAGVDAAVLLEPVEMPYAVFPIKLGAILLSPLHEQLHAGQIGCLRRAMGLDPVR